MRLLSILTVLLVIIMIAGCQTGTGNQAGTSTPFIGGQNGLLQSFIQGTPPDEVFDKGQLEFSIITELENAGESDIAAGAGYVRVEGIKAEDYGVTAADLKKDIPEITGAKKNTDGSVTSGSKETVQFTGLKFLGSVPGTIQAGPIRVEACYDYGTKAVAQLCIREKLTTEQGRELCEPSGEKDVSNSGAPIHATNLVEQPLGNGRVQVTFQITPTGQESDRFYKDGTDCNDDLTNKDRYKVFVDVSEVSGITPNCILEEKNSTSGGLNGAQGYRTLWNGRPQTVSCTLDFGTIESSFRPLLNIDLKYRYSQYIEKGLLVQSMPSG